MLKLIKTREYTEGRKKVSEWEERLEKAGVKEAKLVGREKAAFFSEMKEKRPELYFLFRLNDKMLSEGIIRRLGGKEIIID